MSVVNNKYQTQMLHKYVHKCLHPGNANSLVCISVSCLPRAALQTSIWAAVSHSCAVALVSCSWPSTCKSLYCFCNRFSWEATGNSLRILPIFLPCFVTLVYMQGKTGVSTRFSLLFHSKALCHQHPYNITYRLVTKNTLINEILFWDSLSQNYCAT